MDEERILEQTEDGIGLVRRTHNVDVVQECEEALVFL